MNLLKDNLHNDHPSLVPIGCVLINEHNDYIIKWNGKSIDHCELLAIKEAQCNNWDLRKSLIIITCEPCSMCLTALCLVKIKTIVFGCYNKVFGALGGNFNLLKINNNLYKPEIIGGLDEIFWSQILENFFKKLR